MSKLKVIIEKEIDFSDSDIYRIVEDWLRIYDIKADIIGHNETSQLADDIFNEIQEAFSNQYEYEWQKINRIKDK